MVKGELVSEHAADVMGDEELKATGIWEDLIPLAHDDFVAQARENNLSPIEWLEVVLRSCPLIRVEAIY